MRVVCPGLLYAKPNTRPSGFPRTYVDSRPHVLRAHQLLMGLREFLGLIVADLATTEARGLVFHFEPRRGRSPHLA